MDADVTQAAASLAGTAGLTDPEVGDGIARHCSACGGAGYDPASADPRCPVCGGDLDDAEVGNSSDAAHIVEIRLAFARIECPSCGQLTVLRRDHHCTLCKAPLGEDGIDSTTRRRRHAFKSGIQRLAARAAAAQITNPAFARRGAVLSPSEYIEIVFRPALDGIPASMDAAKAEARVARWDGEDPASQDAFRRIVASAGAGIDMVARLAGVLPPVEMRGVHHLLTRACGEMVGGHIALLSAVIAPNVDDAHDCQRECQRLLDSAAAAAHLVASLIPRLDDLNAPGWWMSGTVFDHASIAWAAMRGRPSGISEAAASVRSTLVQIPGVADLTDAEALLLLPAAVLPLATADSVVVRERTALARELIDRADREVPQWLADPAELVERITSGVRHVNEQILRLGACPTGPEFRRNNAHLMANVYAALVEGPLRDLGGVVVIAARALGGGANASYVPTVARAVQAGDVVQELDRLGDSWRDAASMLFRNASAHAGVRVLDDGIELRQVRSEDGIVGDEKVEKVSDGEFAEEFARLQESMLALQLAVLPWLLTHSNPGVASARAAVVPTDQEIQATIGLLAGLGGLIDVTVGRDDAVVTITARPADPGIDVHSPSIPGLLPDAFHLWPRVERITLSVDGRGSVTFDRAEMPPSEVRLAEENLVAVGLIGRRWQGDCGAAGVQADLIFVCRPHLTALFAVLQYVIDHEWSLRGLADAEQALHRINSRLRRAALPVPQSPLIGEVRNLLIDAARRLRAMRASRARGDISAFRHEARACAGVSDRMGQLSEKVTAALAAEPAAGGSSQDG